jgi:alkylation response protein AidB-like acyl-CoA dehydrogenase
MTDTRHATPAAPGAVPASEPARNPFSVPGAPSLLERLYQGELRGDLLAQYPTGLVTPAGRAVAEEVRQLLAAHVDPDETDESRRLPDGLPALLAPFLHLRADRAAGGRELSSADAFGVIRTAASHSLPAGLLLAFTNGIGTGALLSMLPDGPLRDFVRARVAAGAVTASADSEPHGAANRSRRTTATLSDDGTAWLLNGAKVFVGNATVADLFTVSATVVADGQPQGTRMFVVDAATSGLRVHAAQEFMGLRGFPDGALELRDARVPLHHLVVEAESAVRMTPKLLRITTRGRTGIIAAPALAIAENCLRWSREFVQRRQIDGRGLAEYEEIQRILAATAADLFAIEAVIDWCLAGDDLTERLNVLPEHGAAKNISSEACWRIVERTTSLMAGEGYETARSKAARGAPVVPLERVFRDARGLRIAGGVDFQMDNWAAQLIIFSYLYPTPLNGATERTAADPFGGAALGPRNRAHGHFVAAQVHRFGQVTRAVAAAHPDQAALFAREHLMITLSRIANELLTMALVLARASAYSSGESGPDEHVQDLADVFCTDATARVETFWREFETEYHGARPDRARLVAALLKEDHR